MLGKYGLEYLGSVAIYTFESVADTWPNTGGSLLVW